MKFTGLFSAIFIFAFFPAAKAEKPIDQVRETTDKLIAVLDNPVFAGEDKFDQKRTRLIEVADERIDWYSLCRSCLGRYWRARSPEEKKEFVDLLTQFLEFNYANSIIENFTNLKDIQYVDEKVEGKLAVVRINVLTKNNVRYPVTYRMKRKTEKPDWEIIDIIIEGAGMVSNYRSQFADIITKSSYSDLVEKLKTRLEEQRKS